MGSETELRKEGEREWVRELQREREREDERYTIHTHLVRLDDKANESEKDVLFKLTQSTRVGHPLQSWQPRSCLPSQLYSRERERGRERERERESERVRE